MQRLACSGSSGSGPVFYNPLETRVQLKRINIRTSRAHQIIKNLKTSCCTRTAGPCWVFPLPAVTCRTSDIMDFGVCSSIFTGQRVKLPLLTEEPSWNRTLVTLSVGWNISVLSAAQVTHVCQHLPPHDHSFTSPWQPQSSMPMDDWFHHGWLISHVLTASTKHWDGVPEALLSVVEHFHSLFVL